MIREKLLQVIAGNSGQMAERWSAWVKSSGHMTTYQRLADKDLSKRGQDVFENLAKWLERDFTMEQIGRAYVDIGKNRYSEGFPLCEVQLALHYTKKVLWNHILSEGILTNALEIMQVLDLVIHIQDFFDIASFYIIRGYLEGLYIKLGEPNAFPHERLKSYFPRGSFFFEFKPEW